MSVHRLPDYLDRIRDAAANACAYTEGMSNRIAHGYFEIDLDVVWDTVNTALPALLKNLPPAELSP
jgi:hypothetical protein